MKKKELETRIESLEIRLGACCTYITDTLTITEAKKRDYIVRTKYLGKITHKQIKEDFKAKIEEECGDKFDSIANKLLNYEFHFEGKNILNKFSDTLQKYEYRQIVIDTYGEKKVEK